MCCVWQRETVHSSVRVMPVIRHQTACLSIQLIHQCSHVAKILRVQLHSNKSTTYLRRFSAACGRPISCSALTADAICCTCQSCHVYVRTIHLSNTSGATFYEQRMLTKNENRMKLEEERVGEGERVRETRDKGRERRESPAPPTLLMLPLVVLSVSVAPAASAPAGSVTESNTLTIKCSYHSLPQQR